MGAFWKTPADLRRAAVLGAVLVLPFVILELANRTEISYPFPVILFGCLWLLFVSFALIAMPVVRILKTGIPTMANSIRLLPWAVLLILLAWFSTTLILDQMPCFLGVPNCD